METTQLCFLRLAVSCIWGPQTREKIQAVCDLELAYEDLFNNLKLISTWFIIYVVFDRPMWAGELPFMARKLPTAATAVQGAFRLYI